MLLSSLIISKPDKEKLVKAMERARSSWVTYVPYLDYFRAQLRSAEAVPSEQVPKDVITMNSRFELTDYTGGEGHPYMLVYPEQEAAQLGKISVLSPMGMVLLGARAGDEVAWFTSVGPEVATIKRLLYQPEAAGHHHL